MIILFIVLIAVLCFLLGFFILTQSSKEGGVGTMGGFGSTFSNQFGIKQATNILEKGTYILIGLIALLSIISSSVLDNNATKSTEVDDIISSPLPNNPTVPAAAGTPVPVQPQSLPITPPPSTNQPRQQTK